jgi:general secretion pathway protein K
MRGPERQRGTALITAILVVALATAIAASLTWDLFLDQRRAFGRVAVDQGLMYSLGAEAWAAKILRDDAQDNQVDHPGEPWATQLTPLPIEGGQIQGRIEDLNGRFNLNNLIDAAGATDPVAVEGFRGCCWRSSSTSAWPTGWRTGSTATSSPISRTAPRTEYLSRSRRSARQPAHHERLGDHARLSRNSARPGYATLRPYVTALPRGTRININTRCRSLLTAAEELGPRGERIVMDRPDDGWDSLEQLGDLIPTRPAGRWA